VLACGHLFHATCLFSFVSEPDIPEDLVACGSCRAVRTSVQDMGWGVIEIEAAMDRVKQFKHIRPFE
jgi:hypothetical protein